MITMEHVSLSRNEILYNAPCTLVLLHACHAIINHLASDKLTNNYLMYGILVCKHFPCN